MNVVTADPRSLASRTRRIAPFLALDILVQAAEREKRGESIIHMEIGQPCAPTPRRAREAACLALDEGRIGYTQALGLPVLRERIARYYQDTYGVAVEADRIVVTTGSSAGFILAFLALFEPGARVAVPTPGYPAYRNILEALDLEPVFIHTDASTGWAMTGQALEAAHTDRALAGVLAMSPANPSGVVMTPQALSELATTCRNHGLWFVSDEIYHGLTYERPAQTALAFDSDAIIVNSFSKYFCMTGWRIGWLVVPHRMVRAIERLAQSLYISSPTLSQVAAHAVFEAGEELETIKASYAANRAMLLQELPGLGLGDHPPADGAFYLYCNVDRYTNDATGFCKRLLDEAGVAATPGLDFDADNGHRFMRLSYAGSQDRCLEGVRRLKAWLKR